MSGGMEDAAAHGRQERALREAAHKLAVALREASDGHRGWTMSSFDIAHLVNVYLQDEGAPFELCPAMQSDPCQAPSCSSKRSLVGPLQASYSLDAPEMTPELRKATPKRICTNCYGQLSDAKRAWYVWKD
jgi:hypothetical protein